MSKKKKDDGFNFKELMKTPRGRGILFFGAYLLFFVALAVLARVQVNSNGGGANKYYESGSPLQFSVAGIASNNYKFTYKIVVDNATHVYNGSKTSTSELFTYNNLVEYYFNGSDYFSKNGGIWVNTENPYNFGEFFDVENISFLINSSTYLSKTEYESGRDVYNFKLSSAAISKLLENKDLDIEEVPNELVIGTDEDNYVNEVKFILNSYCKAKNLCTNSMSLTLNYEMFGEILEITSPLEEE